MNVKTLLKLVSVKRNKLGGGELGGLAQQAALLKQEIVMKFLQTQFLELNFFHDHALRLARLQGPLTPV
jgi:hypothetical protein